MKRFMTSTLFLLLLSHVTVASAQDNEGWSSLSLLFKPTKMFRFSIRQELRVDNDLSQVDEYFSQLYLGFKPFKRAEIGGGFRFIKNNDTHGKIQGYETHLRFHLDLKYKLKLDRFRVRFRLRYQNKNELDVAEAEYGNQHLRFKTSFKYNIRRWKFDPILAGEFFYALKEGNQAAGLDKLWITFGTEYKMGRVGRIGLFYRLEVPIDQGDSEYSNIFLLRYKYTF